MVVLLQIFKVECMEGSGIPDMGLVYRTRAQVITSNPVRSLGPLEDFTTTSDPFE